MPQGDARRQLLTHVLLAVSGFLLAWVLVAFVIFPDDGPADAVVVPVVLGLRHDDAQGKLAEAGLDAALGESRISASAPRRTPAPDPGRTPRPGGSGRATRPRPGRRPPAPATGRRQR